MNVSLFIEITIIMSSLVKLCGDNDTFFFFQVDECAKAFLLERKFYKLAVM